MEVPEYNTICSTLFSCNAFPFLAACGNISSCEMLLQVAHVICHQFHKDKTWTFCYFTTQNLEYYLWHSYRESNCERKTWNWAELCSYDVLLCSVDSLPACTSYIEVNGTTSFFKASSCRLAASYLIGPKIYWTVQIKLHLTQHILTQVCTLQLNNDHSLFFNLLCFCRQDFLKFNNDTPPCRTWRRPEREPEIHMESVQHCIPFPSPVATIFYFAIKDCFNSKVFKKLKIQFPPKCPLLTLCCLTLTGNNISMQCSKLHYFSL